MKIKIDKKYKTRDDREYVCYWVGDGQAHGAVINKNGSRIVVGHRDDGCYLFEGGEHALDLIEVKEKKQLTGVFGIFKDGLTTMSFANREEMEGYVHVGKVVAILDLSKYGIFYEEGEGL